MSVSTTRLYGGSIGVVSGGYALWRAVGADGMAGGDWVMSLVGLVALVHGVLLFTSAADAIGDASGPLMLAYALVMLLLQGWAVLFAPAPMSGSGMNGGMGDGMGTTAWAMGADAGMVALALLMLVSGLIMTTRDADGEM